MDGSMVFRVFRSFHEPNRLSCSISICWLGIREVFSECQITGLTCTAKDGKDSSSDLAKMHNEV